MEESKKSIWKLEALWWLFTAIVVVLVLLPIYTTVPDYPFYLYNTIFVVVAITYTRYIWMLKHTPIARSQVIKIIIIATALPVAVLLVDGLAEFQKVVDEEGYVAFLGHLTPESLTSLGKYIRSQYFFFGVTSVICAVIFPIRMIVSIWRVRNRDTV